MEEKIMAVKIIGIIIGALVLGAGIYYLVNEKNDTESRKIYSIVSAVGGVIFVLSVILTIAALR